MPLFDYHIHTELCGHARGSMEEYLECALQSGIKEIGISDHLPLLHTVDPGLSMSREQLPGYVQAVLRLRRQYAGRLTLKLGIEVDYIPGYEPGIKALLQQYPFDYVLGSVHYLNGWMFDHPDYLKDYEGKDPYQVYADYFALVARAARSGVCDILAHPDLIKKFNYRPPGPVTELYRKFVAEIKATGVCLEINTSGLRKPVREIYSTPELLQLAREAGIDITFGSDSHKPEEVGKDFDQALALAKAAGYRSFASFTARDKTLMPF